MEAGKGLKPAGEVGRGTRAVHYARRNGSGHPPAEGPQGWVVCAGMPSSLPSAILQDASLLEELDGSYAVARFDATAGILTVQPDPLGRLHVWVAEDPAGVYVGTSAIALAAATSGEADPLAIAEFLATGNCYEERSVFRRVRRLQGGRRYRFRDGRPIDSVPTPHLLPPAGEPSGRVGPEELAEAAAAALRPFLGGLRHPLSDLTGGLDSRVILGLLRRCGSMPDVTVTGPRDHPDVRVATALAKRLGLAMLHEDSAVVSGARTSFDAVLKAAAQVEGEFDAVEYAAIARVHEGHAATHDASVNGSGGEVLRNYWWEEEHLGGDRDPVALGTPRFAKFWNDPGFLAERVEGRSHFSGVVARALAGRGADPVHAQMDHIYLHLRMQCWQGAIASATNQILPNLSPLLLSRTLEAVFATDPRRRLGARLIYDLFRLYGPPFSTQRLATGWPPRPFSLTDAWRFLPGLLETPMRLRDRLRARRAWRGGIDEAGAERVKALFRSGAADFFRPAEMAVAPLCDRPRLEALLQAARDRGAVPSSLVGRLLATEFALRAAR